MSSLIFFADHSQAFVATDTLAVLPDGKPFMFTSKAFILPHLKLIIAGTGISGFCDRWFIQVNNRLIVRGIDNLNYYTPKILPDLWMHYRQEVSLPDHLTTTIYHFGFSEDTHVIHSYAYRSTNNFTSEPVIYGSALNLNAISSRVIIYLLISPR